MYSGKVRKETYIDRSRQPVCAMSAANESADSEDSFVLVDDDGIPFENGAEGSAMMAAEYGFDLAVTASDEWYMVNLRDFESTRSALEQAILQLDNADDTPEAAPRDGGDDLGTIVNDTDASMDAADGFSREYSDQTSDEEWVLENILKRRVVKGAAATRDDDGNVHPTHEYLCKWKWYAEPTWESRGAVEELGYVAQLDAFDFERLPAKCVKLNPGGNEKKNVARAGLLEETLGGEDFFRRVLRIFANEDMGIISYAPVGNKDLESQFLRKWSQCPAGFTPAILFHGTRAANIPSIVKRGLLVPSACNAVRVENGSAYGVGIYSAKCPSYSRSYARDSDAMFVCVGLVGPQYQTVKEVSNIVVFFDPSLIVPLYLVKFDRERTATAERLSSWVHVLHSASVHKDSRPAPTMQLARIAVTCPVAERIKGFSKRMVKQLPRSIKELYKAGELRPLRNK